MQANIGSASRKETIRNETRHILAWTIRAAVAAFLIGLVILIFIVDTANAELIQDVKFAEAQLNGRGTNAADLRPQWWQETELATAAQAVAMANERRAQFKAEAQRQAALAAEAERQRQEQEWLAAQASPPIASSPPSSSSPSGSPSGGGDDAKAYIYEHESGNDPWAVNPSSGACGLGQALPCSKMPCTLGDYACQDSYFTSYMLGRYGTWEAAMYFHMANNWW